MGVMTAIGIGSLIAGAYSSYRQGQAAKAVGQAGQDAANSQADLADKNAQIADAQSQDAIARGAQEEARFRTGVRGLIGTQRTGFAAGNIDVSSGSAVDVQADTAFRGELDALQIKNNAAREAWGYSTQAADLRARATIARKTGVFAAAAGDTAATSAYLGGATSLLTGAANLYTAKYGFSTPKSTSGAGGYAPLGAG